ncbi:MAG: hypothetical protein GY710_02070 [Desulfobacteraceae bacterium]|nr:hypothetical protein [Desulfobacteraceae bacterium]
MTKNEIKTMTAVAFGQAAIRKIGINPKMYFAVENAFYVWEYNRNALTSQNIKQSSRWLKKFDQALWQGAEQDAHVHLSFAVAILERQAEFLSGRKLKAIDYLIEIMLRVYNDLPESLHSENYCSDLASRAVTIWEEVINE